MGARAKQRGPNSRNEQATAHTPRQDVHNRTGLATRNSSSRAAAALHKTGASAPAAHAGSSAVPSPPPPPPPQQQQQPRTAAGKQVQHRSAAAMAPAAAAARPASTPAAVRKIHRALLPLFASLVAVCYIDRTSLSFAALQLCHQQWFNARVYGLGSGIFYAGYVTFQIPSNLLLARLGARLWLPLITAAWGLVAACCVFISSPASFYALRFALGVAEAGAFPGCWYVCGQFYPARWITVPYAVMEASIAVSQILAAPAAAVLLQLAGVGGLAGWQWLFLAEGIATLGLAAVLRWRLPASVLSAPFLDETEKAWLLQQLSAGSCGSDDSSSSSCHAPGSTGLQHLLEAGADASGRLHAGVFRLSDSSSGGPGLPGIVGSAGCHLERGDGDHAALLSNKQQQLLHGIAGSMSAGQQVLATLRNPLIRYLMLLKALKDIALDGLVYWLPLLVHALLDGSALRLSPAHSASSGEDGRRCGGKDSQLRAVLISAIPFTAAAIMALLLGHSSERMQERKLHVGVPLLLGGAAFMLLPLLLPLTSHLPAFVAVTAAVVAADATTGPFWSWVHMAAAPGTGAVSLAAVNSVGKAGGLLGPLSFGLMLHATGSYVPSILLVGLVMIGGGVLAMCYPGERHSYAKLAGDAAGEVRQQELARLAAPSAAPGRGWEAG